MSFWLYKRYKRLQSIKGRKSRNHFPGAISHDIMGRIRALFRVGLVKIVPRNYPRNLFATALRVA